MKKNCLLPVFFILVLLLFSSQAVAFYPYGTVPQSLGGAYSALGDDMAALYYNPAALNPPFLFEAGLFTGFYADEISVDSLTKLANLFSGFDAEDFQLDDLKIDPQQVTIYGLGGMQFNIPTLSLSPALAFFSDHDLHFHSEVLDYVNRDTLLFNTRYTVLSPPLDLMSFTVGANVKLLSGEIHQFRIVDADTILDNGVEEDFIERVKLDTGSGYAVDVGLLVKATNLLTLGISVQDLLYSFSWDEEGPEEAPMSLRGGAAVQVPLLALTFTGDVENFSHNQERLNRLHMGVEKGFFFNTLILRGGAYSQPEKETEEMIYTAGLGLNFRAVKANLSILSQGFTDFKGLSFSGGVRF